MLLTLACVGILFAAGSVVWLFGIPNLCRLQCQPRAVGLIQCEGDTPCDWMDKIDVECSPYPGIDAVCHMTTCREAAPATEELKKPCVQHCLSVDPSLDGECVRVLLLLAQSLWAAASLVTIVHLLISIRSEYRSSFARPLRPTQGGQAPRSAP